MTRGARIHLAAPPLRRPLLGLRVVVTRAREQAGDLCEALQALGAEPVPFPVLALRPPARPRALDRALDRLALYDWLVFTSANGVERFFARLERRGRDLRAVGHLKLAVVGAGTAEALAAYRLRADVVPRRFVAEALAAALARVGVQGARILLARARDAREDLPELLARQGAAVDDVETYRMVPVGHPPDRVRRWLLDAPADVLTFASAQTARNFAAAVGRPALRHLRAHAACVSLGPVTSRALREIGLPPTEEARRSDLKGLVAAVVRAVKGRGTRDAERGRREKRHPRTDACRDASIE